MFFWRDDIYMKKKEIFKKTAGFFKKIGSKIKGLFVNIHDKFRTRFPKKEMKYYDGDLHQRKYIGKLAITAFFMYLYIEMFARITTGVFAGVLFLFQHPIIFAYNWLIIFSTMLIALMFKKRGFVLLIISIIWGALGTVNGIILIKRMTPFTLYDMQNAADGISLVTNYYSKIQIILVGAALAIGVAIVVIYCISCEKWKNINYKKSALTIITAFALCLGATFGLLKIGGLSTFFGNLNYAYTDYGFPYCFINTSVNTGISRPTNYSSAEIEEILKKYTKNGTSQTLTQKSDDQDYPNVIILQMESFTRAQDYKNIKVSNDPTPVFTSLTKNYTSGWFEVPACGAGTANTEFEVLTGISAKFFGPGEYPYKGKLRKQTLESMAYVLKSRGFATGAMHDHRGLFYNRNEVYPDLGFDNFTSIEYMNNVAKTPTGWAKDKVLTSNIIDEMKSTKSRDFLHVVSVEGHGSYPTEQVFKDPYTTVTASDTETKWKYEYYVNELHEMDTFIGNLIEQINETGEPTVILIYGDHIPALDIKESDYGNGDLYQTRYVLWDNIGLKKTDENVNAYESGSKILSKIGLSHLGTIFDYEQTADKNSKTYKSNLKALSYDMLYGDNFVFGGTNPFKRTNMKLGFKKIEIDNIVKIGDSYYIRGKNFTEHSKVSLDGKVLKTIYLSPTLLGLQETVDPDDVSKLEVSQIDTKDDSILTTINSLEEL